jgi:hypothetical protein
MCKLSPWSRQKEIVLGDRAEDIGVSTDEEEDAIETPVTSESGST